MSWLNYHHLLSFHAVARAGSVTRAARGLRVSPSTLSQQVKQLEEALGGALLHRTGRGVALTALGEQVQGFAQQVFQTGQALLAAVAAGEAPSSRPLAVGVAEQLPKDTVRRALEPALRLRCGLELREGRPDLLWEQLADHRLDLVVSDEPLPAADRVEGARQVRLLDEPAMVWGSEGLRAVHQPRFPAGLDGAPFILPARGTAIRRRFDAWIHGLGARPRVVAECEDRALALALARAGHGLTVAPLDGSAPRGLVVLGDAPSVRETTWGLALAPRLAHPAVAAILG